MTPPFGPYWRNAVIGMLGEDKSSLTTQTLWIALGTAAPMTNAGANLALFECCGNNSASYVRMAINTAYWAAIQSSIGTGSATGAFVWNSASFTWPAAAANSAWGDISYIAIMTASTPSSGTAIVGWTTAAATRTVSSGDIITIGTNSLSIALT